MAKTKKPTIKSLEEANQRLRSANIRMKAEEKARKKLILEGYRMEK